MKAARARMYRELVFESAERLFAANGFDHTTIQDIADEAGISLNTLYSAYKGKGEIYDDILATRGGAFMAAVESGMRASEDSVLARLEASVRAYTRFLIDHDAFLRIVVRDGRNWGLAPPDEKRRSRWRQGLALSTPLLARGMREGIFYEGDPDMAAATLQALMQTLLAGLVWDGRKRDVEDITDEIHRQACRLLCRPEGFASSRLRVVS